MAKHPCVTRGFTLVEMLISMAVLALFLGISIPYLSETRNQHLLRANADHMATVFQMARQYSLAAKPSTVLGVPQPIKVKVDITNPIILTFKPGIDPPKTFGLTSGITIDNYPVGSSVEVEFNKLYGTLNSSPAPSFTLKYKTYKVTVEVISTGDISISRVSKL
jgi:prepilin-type N-terminal cleavage/methylation domain-containing protein